MGVIQYTTKERDLLARLMRAEALGEGDMGMLMVGNVGVNRVLGDCLDFSNIRTIQQMIYQSPGGFVGKDSPLFNGTPTTKERNLADRALRGEYYYPATHALWFYSPGSNSPCLPLWYNQQNAGRFKNHCFYVPAPGVCQTLY